MWPYIFPIVMAIIANVFYHIFQKATPSDVNPILSLLGTYLTAALTCLVVLPFYPNNGSFADSIKKLNWTSLSLGVAIVALELGFILAYRAGWNITTAGVLVNVTVALILIPIGILAFKEHLTVANSSGILLCIIGLVLIAKK